MAKRAGEPLPARFYAHGSFHTFSFLFREGIRRRRFLKRAHKCPGCAVIPQIDSQLIARWVSATWFLPSTDKNEA